MLDLLRGVSVNQAADQKPVKSKTLGLDMSISLSLGFPSLQTCQTTFIICLFLLYLSPTLKMYILLFTHTMFCSTGIIYLPFHLYCMCSLSRGFQRTLPLQFQSPTTSLSLFCYLVYLTSSLFSRFLGWLRPQLNRQQSCSHSKLLEVNRIELMSFAKHTLWLLLQL